jgi:hypothetical protein
MGRHPFLINPFFDSRIPLFAVLLFFCLKEIRDYYQNGEILFLHGLLSCLVFTAVFATMTSLLLWIFCVMQPAFVAKYIEGALAQFATLPPEMIERMGKASLDQSLEALPSTTALDLAIDYFLKSFIMSFFISVIVSVILRRQVSRPGPE